MLKSLAKGKDDEHVGCAATLLDDPKVQDRGELVKLLVGIKVLLLPALPFAVALLTFTGVFTAAEVTLWSRQNFSPRVQPS